MGKLSHALLDLGFLSVLGTCECMDGKVSYENLVLRKTPNTYDYNNGVHVVYDEEGRPWIFFQKYVRQGPGIGNLISSYGLIQGAYVPHSNDGGQFMHVIEKSLHA